jgi:ubiquinone/menaquinone biosynthesis C-methylase UbiE
MRASSTGQQGSEAGYLDVRFEACRPAFEAMLRSVGIQPGWHVLDAGCGSGGFLPLLSQLVGTTGHLTAFDLAPDNVAVVQRRAAQSAFSCPVVAQQGALTALPYPDRHFDAVWCANTLQYLSDSELLTALGEFRRVVRPGGLVAIKEVDMGLTCFGPADPALLWHLLDAGRKTDLIRGWLRARELRTWLVRAGLVDVWQQPTLDDHRAPLQPAERQVFGQFLSYFGSLAERYGVPASDRAFWQAQRDPAESRHLIHDPEFFYCEGDIVAVGRVPAGTANQDDVRV